MTHLVTRVGVIGSTNKPSSVYAFAFSFTYFSFLFQAVQRSNSHHHWWEFLLGTWSTVPGAQLKKVTSLLTVGCSIRFSFRQQFTRLSKDKSARAIRRDWWTLFRSAAKAIIGVGTPPRTGQHSQQVFRLSNDKDTLAFDRAFILPNGILKSRNKG